MSFPAAQVSALRYRQELLAGRFTAAEGIRCYLDRLARVDAELRALTETFADSAIREAEASDRRRAAGEEPRPLEGIPFTCKANICTREGTSTAGSAILAEFRSPTDATAVERLRAAGAILVGKTNQDEFGMGGSTEFSPVPTRNPWDLERVPGGSSGGAAALAAALGWGFHLGSDTGGSVRQPAAYCGSTGFKPTYGRVSRSGLIAFGSSLDQIGPLTVDVADAEAVWRVMAGSDGLDATSRAEPVRDSARALRTIGIPREFFPEGIEPRVDACVREAIEALAGADLEARGVSLPHTAQANACYQVISTAEASSNLSRYDGMRFGARAHATTLPETYRKSRAEGFGAEVKRRILLGTFVLSSGYYEAFYAKALEVRTRLRQDFARVFEEVDIVVAPTVPNVAFRLGEKVADPLEIYACDVLTVSANLAGVPALSVPCGFGEGGLPIGLQIIGPELGDEEVLAIGRRFQELTDHHTERASVAGAED